MLLQLIGISGGLLAFSSYVPYVRDILHYKVRPQRATFAIWLVLGLIVVFSQLAKGATNSLWLPSLGTFGVLIIFLLSIKYGVGGFSKRDYIALLFAALGLVAWYFTKEAAIALYLVILIESVGYYLTIHKTYLNPETETHIPWILASLGGLITALSVGSFNVTLLSYPVFCMFADATVVLAIQMGLKRKL